MDTRSVPVPFKENSASNKPETKSFRDAHSGITDCSSASNWGGVLNLELHPTYNYTQSQIHIRAATLFPSL